MTIQLRSCIWDVQSASQLWSYHNLSRALYPTLLYCCINMRGIHCTLLQLWLDLSALGFREGPRVFSMFLGVQQSTPWNDSRAAHVQTLYTEVASNTLGPKAQKARYFGYTDASFSTRVVQPAEHGILGPLISAEVSRRLLLLFSITNPLKVHWRMPGSPNLIGCRFVHNIPSCMPPLSPPAQLMLVHSCRWAMS